MEVKQIAGIIILIIGIVVIIGGAYYFVTYVLPHQSWWDIFRVLAAVLFFIGGFLSIAGLILLISGRKKD